MSEHTPGPWEAVRLIDHDGKAYSTHYLAHIDLGVCMIWAPPGNIEQEANARLIAAAPDLLEALEYLIQDQPGTQVFDRWWPERVKAARAAIAKAKGE